MSSHASASLYHTSAWRRVVASAFRRPTACLVARDDAGHLRGVLPLIRQPSRVFGDRLVSVPYCNHGGPLSDSPVVADALYAEAARVRSALGADRLEIRDQSERALDWPVRTEKVLMMRELPEDPEQLRKDFGSKLRSQVRRCRRESPEVCHGGVELLPDFYAVFCRNMHQLGTPVYPLRWFETIGALLGSAMHVVVIRLASRPAAAAVLLKWRRTVEIPWASSLREFSRQAPNMLLYDEAMVWAIGQGARTFDFGRSTPGEGTYRFKAQWGGEPRQLYWYEEGKGAGQDSGGRREQFARVWSRLPLWLANALGPRITVNLPW